MWHVFCLCWSRNAVMVSSCVSFSVCQCRFFFLFVLLLFCNSLLSVSSFLYFASSIQLNFFLIFVNIFVFNLTYAPFLESKLNRRIKCIENREPKQKHCKRMNEMEKKLKTNFVFVIFFYIDKNRAYHFCFLDDLNHAFAVDSYKSSWHT